MNSGPSWQWPQCPVPQVMLRSSDSQMRSSLTPRSCSASAAKRIITSGPQIIATALSASKIARGIRRVTTPTRPRQSASATSTITSTSTSKRPPQGSSSVT